MLSDDFETLFNYDIRKCGLLQFNASNLESFPISRGSAVNLLLYPSFYHRVKAFENT